MKFRISNKEDKERIIATICQLDPQKTYVGEIKQFRRKRSLSQNALYWLWITAISVQTGSDAEDLHDYFKTRYCPRYRYDIFGVAHERSKSTKEMTTEEFAKYLDCIYKEIMGSAIAEICYPNDRFWDNFYEEYSEKV